MGTCAQPEDVADRITALHKELELLCYLTEDPQVHCKAFQDDRIALASLNEIIYEETLIQHGLCA